MINPEELKYYIALQEFFKEKMGEWRWYDRWYDSENGEDGVVLPGQLTEFRRGDFQEFIRLPLPIDPYKPERGLLEMIKGINGDLISIHQTETQWCCCFFNKISGFVCWYAPTPTLALLKALARQEGIEVE